MFALQFRSSKAFVTFVVGVAIFTDMLLANIIVPILPYILIERIGFDEDDVQKWSSILLVGDPHFMIAGLFFEARSRAWIPDFLSFIYVGTSCLNPEVTLIVFYYRHLIQQPI